MVCEKCGWEGSRGSCDLCGGQLVPGGGSPNVRRERFVESEDGERKTSFVTGPAAIAQYDQAKAEGLEHLRSARAFLLVCEIWDEEEEVAVMKADICSGPGTAEDLPTNMQALLSHTISVAVSSVANLAGELAIEEYKQHGE